MQRARVARWIHPAAFLAAVGAVYAVSISIVGMLPRLGDAELLGAAVTIDLVLVVPALYWLLLVRGRGWRAIGLVPVFLAGLVAASWIVPVAHQRLLSTIEWAAIPLELVVIGLIARRATVSLRQVRGRVREDGRDVLEAIREAAIDAVGSPRIGEMLAQEIATLWFALGSWRTPLPRGREGFTSYRENAYGPVLTAVGIVLVIETVAVHVAVHLLWSGPVAFVLSALGLYGLVWMIGDFRALRLRVTTVTPRAIEIRLGMRWDLDVPRDAVAGIARVPTSRGAAGDPADRPLRLVLIGSPDVELRLSRPVTARGMFGLRRTVSRILLQIDDAERFVERVRAWSETDSGD